MNPLLIRRRGMMEARQGGLPYDAEIEYLESDGTQYINTGIYADNETSVSMRARQTDVFNDNCFIGMDEGTSDTKSFCVEYFYTNTSRFGLLLNFDSVTRLYQSGVVGNTNWHVISASKDNLIVDGNVYNTQFSPPSAFTAIYPLFMYAFGRNGSPFIFSKVSMSYCKIFSNGVLVRDFIPVRVGTVGYMYDRVSGQLFGNMGTGDFVLGPDVI